MCACACAPCEGSPDSEYLAEFFVELEGGSWLDSTGWTNDSAAMGDRFGISTTTNANGTECVSKIELPGNNLVGESFLPEWWQCLV